MRSRTTGQKDSDWKRQPTLSLAVLAITVLVVIALVVIALAIINIPAR